MLRNRLKDRVVAVAGAHTEIGRVAAITFARLGAAVALIGDDPVVLAAVANDCRRAGAHVIAVGGHPAVAADMAAAAHCTAGNLGRVDVWFAAVPVDRKAPAVATMLADPGVDTVLGLMREQGGGLVVGLAGENHHAEPGERARAVESIVRRLGRRVPGLTGRPGWSETL